MANPSCRRFACLCLLLLSVANPVVFGQIRGANNVADNAALSEAIDNASIRLLKREVHIINRALTKGVEGVQQAVSEPFEGKGDVQKLDLEPPGNRLLKRNKRHTAKGGAKGVKGLVTEPIEGSEFPASGSPTESETLVPAHPKGVTKGAGIKGGVKGGVKEVKHKVKGAKQSKDKATTDLGDKDKGGKKSATDEVPIEDKSGKSTKAKSSKYDGKAVEKKQKENNSKGKSKDKLMKSADGKSPRYAFFVFHPE
jgi:hypothetical protein